jgi:hypothetical protein
LNAELEELEQQELDEKLLGVEAPPTFTPRLPNLGIGKYTIVTQYTHTLTYL